MYIQLPQAEQASHFSHAFNTLADLASVPVLTATGEKKSPSS